MTGRQYDNRHCSRQLMTYRTDGWLDGEVIIALQSDVLSVSFATRRVEKVEKWYDPTPDLAAQTAMFVANLMPVGVYADALQDQHPELEQVCNFLREWEKVQVQQPSEWRSGPLTDQSGGTESKSSPEQETGTASW